MRYRSVVLLFVATLLSGCGVREPAEWKSLRNQLLLKDRPSGAITIAQAIATPSEEEVLIVAQIGSGKGDTFDSKFASFLISEAPDDAHRGKPSHDPDGCPFCKQKLANAPTVTVDFSNDRGETIAADASKLFGVSKGDIVVIRGKSEYEESMKLLNIKATGLHVVRELAPSH